MYLLQWYVSLNQPPTQIQNPEEQQVANAETKQRGSVTRSLPIVGACVRPAYFQMMGGFHLVAGKQILQLNWYMYHD